MQQPINLCPSLPSHWVIQATESISKFQEITGHQLDVLNRVREYLVHVLEGSTDYETEDHWQMENDLYNIPHSLVLFCHDPDTVARLVWIIPSNWNSLDTYEYLKKYINKVALNPQNFSQNVDYLNTIQKLYYIICQLHYAVLAEILFGKANQFVTEQEDIDYQEDDFKEFTKTLKEILKTHLEFELEAPLESEPELYKYSYEEFMENHGMDPGVPTSNFIITNQFVYKK